MTMLSNRTAGSAEASDDFETSFTKLQEVVRTLSEGSLTLQEALSAFEQGMSLADHCASLLEEAELRVRQVSERSLRAGLTAGPAGSLELDGGLVEVQIEEVEHTIVYEAQVPASSADPPSGKSEPSRRATASALFEELDPLFDDSD